MKYVTRPKVNLDRTASAWLIKRHIDSEAELVFLPNKDWPPDRILKEYAGATYYDLNKVGGGLFIEEGQTDSVFTRLVDRNKISDPVIHKIRDLLRKSSQVGSVAHALNTLILGWRSRQDEHDEKGDFTRQLDAHFAILDDLYALLKNKPEHVVN